MFDLPIDTAEEKRSYRYFRKSLIEMGFVMMQYSVYVRTCPSRDMTKRIEKKVEGIIPDNGNIRLLTVTEKQYEEMRVLVGSKNETEKLLNTERLIVL